MSRARFLATIAVMVPLCGACLGGCGHAETAASTAPRAAAEPTTIQTVPVAEVEWSRTVKVQGAFRADDHAILGSKIAGPVSAVLVDLGSLVKAGDVVATLDTRDTVLRAEQMTAEVNQVRAKLGLAPDQPDEALDAKNAPSVRQEQVMWDEAKTILKRAQELYSRGVNTEADLDTAQAALKVAEARYAAAVNAVQEQVALLKVKRSALAVNRQELDDAQIRAPFQGVVAMRQASPGVYLHPGDAVITLVRTDPLRFRAGVPERVAQGLEPGRVVMVSVPGQHSPLAARITRISPMVDDGSRSITIEADVDNADRSIRVGLFAEAEIEIDPSAHSLAVPEESVFEFAGLEKVWVIEDGKAREQLVKTGRKRNGTLEIVSGLTANQTIAKTAAECRAGPVIVKSASSASTQAAD